MIYIVSGFMRSGTSCMMQCLAAGGLSPAYSEKRENMNKRFGDNSYLPNKGGFYEIAIKEYSEPEFPIKYEGKLIKVMSFGMNNLSVHEYKIVFLKRDPEEIRQSYEGFFGKPLDGPVIDNYEGHCIEVENRMLNRKDVLSFDVIDYRDLIDHTGRELRKLSNWPIDTDLAAEQVDPNQYRFKKELLSQGEDTPDCCKHFSRSSDESYSIERPVDLGPLVRLKVRCGRDGADKTVEECLGCWQSGSTVDGVRYPPQRQNNGVNDVHI